MRDSKLVDLIINDPMREYCKEAKKQVPFFKKMPAELMNRYIADKIAEMNRKPMKPGRDIEGSRE